MDRLESMTAFVAVARAGGFSAAARETGVPLATLSRRVADLEAALGVRLLTRSTRHVSLSESGQGYFSACERLLDELRDAEEAATGEYRSPKGDLTVTAPLGFGRLHLQPVVLEFLAAYPEINLRLVLADRVVDLVDEHVDLALRIADLPDSGLIARPLGHVRVVVAASPDYLARRGTPGDPEALAAHDCIAWTSLGPQTAWWFRTDGVDRTVAIRPRLATTTADSAVAAARSGLGLAQTTCYQAEAGVRDGTLQIVLREHECLPTPVTLVHAGRRLLPLKTRAFLDYAAPRLAERLADVARATAPAVPPARSRVRRSRAKGR